MFGDWLGIGLPWRVVTALLRWASPHLHQLNCHYLAPWVFSLLFFLLVSPSHWGGREKVSKQLYGFLAAGWGQPTTRKYCRSEMQQVIVSFLMYRHMLSYLNVQSRDSQQRSSFGNGSFLLISYSLLPSRRYLRLTSVNASISFYGKVKNFHAKLPSAVTHRRHLTSP